MMMMIVMVMVMVMVIVVYSDQIVMAKGDNVCSKKAFNAQNKEP